MKNVTSAFRYIMFLHGVMSSIKYILNVKADLFVVRVEEEKRDTKRHSKEEREKRKVFQNTFQKEKKQKHAIEKKIGFFKKVKEVEMNK